MLMLTRMSQVSTRAVSRRSNNAAQTSLPRTLLSIAALSVNVATDPHVGKNTQADLEILQQAVRLTKPWIEAVLENIVQHFPLLAVHGTQPEDRQARSLQDRSSLGALLKLLSVFWKVSRLLKSGNGVPRQARVLKRLHSALSTELASAEREIERLKALLERKQGRRRKRKDPPKVGSEDEWEDVAASAAATEHDWSLPRGEGPVVLGGKVTSEAENMELKSTKTQRESQDAQKDSKKTSMSRPNSSASQEDASPRALPEVSGIAGMTQFDEQGRGSSQRSSNSKAAAPPRANHQFPGKSSKSSKSRADWRIFDRSPLRSKHESPDAPPGAVSAMREISGFTQGRDQNRHGSKGNSRNKATPSDRASPGIEAISSKSSKTRADSKLDITAPGTADGESRQSSARSSRKCPVSQIAKGQETWSPAISRSGTASRHSKHSTAVKEPVSSKASSVSPRRGRRTSPKDLTKGEDEGKAAASNHMQRREVISADIHEDGSVTTADIPRSRTSSRPGSQEATVSGPGNRTEGAREPKASSSVPVTGSSKRSARNVSQGVLHAIQIEAEKPATSPSSLGSKKSSMTHRDQEQESRSLEARITSPAKLSSKSRSISPNAAHHSGTEGKASTESSPSPSSTKSTRSAQHAPQTTTNGHQGSESVDITRSGCHCQESARPRKCHHAGSLASSGCTSKAWSCELSLDAQGVLQLKADHFHRRPDGC